MLNPFVKDVSKLKVVVEMVIGIEGSLAM
jgi:hypothetical protein